MGDPLQDRRPLAEWVSGEQVIEISDYVGSFERLADAIRVDLAESIRALGESRLQDVTGCSSDLA